MKSNLLATVLLSLLLAPLSLATPIIVNGVESVGAAYTMTNQPDDNFLVALSIGKNGTLSFYDTIPTGGKGAQGLEAPIGDSIFSEGSIQIHYGKNLLINCNTGSSTLTLWSVDPTNPLNISMIGNPVPSGGDFPNSVTFNKAGDRLCASNTGTRNGLMCFIVDTESGLIPIPDSFRPYGLNQTVPATGPMNSASHIRFSPDETKIYLSSKGWDAIGTRGFLAIWDVDLKSAGTVAVAQTSNRLFTDGIGFRPFGMTYVNGRNAIIAADSIAGFTIFDLDKGTARSMSLPNSGAHCWAIYSNKTDRYYIIDANAATITEVSVDITKDILEGVVTSEYPKIPGSFLADPDVVPIGDKEYLMTLSPGILSIYIDELRGPQDAVPVQRFDLSVVNTISGIPFDQNHTNGFITYLNDQYAPVLLP
ncbi:hypothetical protein AX15_004592 [Amanita polypyramis BW_CC]|nr:hypothetical protein AX15_004592 [Amanita polypyramis BW_CC]